MASRCWRPFFRVFRVLGVVNGATVPRVVFVPRVAKLPRAPFIHPRARRVKKEEAFNKFIVQVLSIGSPSTQIARFYENYNLIQNENLTFKQKVLLALQFSKYQVIGKPKKRELSIAERNAKYRRRKK